MALTQPDGYLAIPPFGTGPGALVLHAWWGLNDTIKAFCNRLAQAGFAVFAPDLYHGKIARTIPEAEAMVKTTDAGYLQTRVELAQAVRFLNEQTGSAEHGIAVIGFSMGAFYALDLSNQDPEHIRSVVVYYGTGAEDFSNSRATYLGHFAENDPFEPASSVDALEEMLQSAGRPVTFYRYRGTEHWFAEPDRTDAYDRAAAELAWDRTLAFLNRGSNP